MELLFDFLLDHLAGELFFDNLPCQGIQTSIDLMPAPINAVFHSFPNPLSRRRPYGLLFFPVARTGSRFPPRFGLREKREDKKSTIGNFMQT